MRPHWRALPFLVPALAAAFALAAPPTNEARHDAVLVRSPEADLARRDGDHMHGHNHHDEPKIVFNESELLLYHDPTPPSYWSIDFEDMTPNETRYPGFMVLHGVFMSLAFFGALPVGTLVLSLVCLNTSLDTPLPGIALRSVKHALHGFSVIMFYTFVVLGLASSAVYRKLTPNM